MSKSIKFTLVDEQNRKKLGEGRSCGLGTTLAIRDKNVLTTAYPITACKDYVNEMCVSEHNGKNYRFHGLSTQKCGLFKDGNAYLIFGILPYQDGTEYPLFDKDLTQLEKNYRNIQKFLNWFEKKLNIKPTEIHKIEKNRYVAVLDSWWTKYTYLISLYGLLLRMALHYSDGDPIEFLDANKRDADYYNWYNSKAKVDKILEGKLPKQDYDTIHVHNCGIVSCQFE